MEKEQIQENLEQLIIQGTNFTFENFSKKTRRGAVSVLDPKWSVWIESIWQALQIFPLSSSAISEFNKAKAVNLIGYHENKFEEAQQAFLASLELAIINLPGIEEEPPENPNAEESELSNRNSGPISASLQIDLNFLRDMMLASFNQNELVDICWELNIDHETLQYDEKRELTREIITYLERRNRLHILIMKIVAARPNQDWARIFLS